MDEKNIRKIAQEVYENMANRSQFSVSRVPFHAHTGSDSPRINQENITLGTRINSGTITFSQTARYTLGINFNPSQILVYGIVVDDISSPTVRANCTGCALLGGSYYFEPSTSTSVTTAQDIQDITQSSSYFLANSTTTPPSFHALADQTHLVDVEFSSTIWFRMTVESYSSSGIVLNVENSSSGWSFIGNFIIT